MEPLIEVGHQLELSETRREAAIPQVSNTQKRCSNMRIIADFERVFTASMNSRNLESKNLPKTGVNVHPAPENSVSNPDKLKKPEKSVSESSQSSEHFPLSWTALMLHD